MLYLITLLALAAASPAFEALADAKGISIPLEERNLSTEGGMTDFKAPANQANRDATKHSKNSFSLFQSQKVPLESSDGKVWTSQIKIGTPAKSFTVYVDTGTSYTWVTSSACVGPKYSTNNKYDASKSSTSKREKGKLDVTYAGGSRVVGPIYADTVTVGGLSASQQLFSPVNQVSGLNITRRDGLLGLALESGPRSRNATFIDTLFRHKKITKRIFSMYLSSGPGSELYIGGINPQKYRGEITYLPRRSEHHWIVEGSVRANGKEVYRGVMAINSGTTLIFGPKKSVEEWWGNVFGSAPCPEKKCGGSGYFTFPCNFDASLSFKFNDREFPVAKDDLILRKLEKNKLICVGAIRAMDHDMWILGARFMKSVYTIFDADMSRVGFATPA